MTPEQRAAWLDDARSILTAVEYNPGLPLPYISKREANFYLEAILSDFTGGPRILDDAEAVLSDALSVTFTQSDQTDESFYILEGVMPSGLKVLIRASSPSVADRHVTGTRVVEEVQWVRKDASAEQVTDEEGQA